MTKGRPLLTKSILHHQSNLKMCPNKKPKTHNFNQSLSSSEARQLHPDELPRLPADRDFSQRCLITWHCIFHWGSLWWLPSSSALLSFAKYGGKKLFQGGRRKFGGACLPLLSPRAVHFPNRSVAGLHAASFNPLTFPTDNLEWPKPLSYTNSPPLKECVPAICT